MYRCKCPKVKGLPWSRVRLINDVTMLVDCDVSVSCDVRCIMGLRLSVWSSDAVGLLPITPLASCQVITQWNSG